MNIRTEFTAINVKTTSTLKLSGDGKSNPEPYETLR